MSEIEVNTGDFDLDSKIQQWFKWDRNNDTRQQVKELLENKNVVKLNRLMMKRINFGTAGLRAKMEAGFASMNDLVIIQTSQGLLKYLLANDSENLLQCNGIVIGFDGRYNSRKFAELTATIFINAGIGVHFFFEEVPTPFVPFAVTENKCAAGIMVTASHNPKEDNGYKVYGSNGCQIISPVDKQIEESILENLEPYETSWDVKSSKELFNHDLVQNSMINIVSRYFAILNQSIPKIYKDVNRKASITITYTPVHGVGYKFIKQCFNEANLTNLVVVEEQKDIDPDFSTVKYPNPEEGKCCLDLAFSTAVKNNSKIILANDPDADRLAIAEKDLKTQNWRIFNGNEIGAILGFWMLKLFLEKNPNADLSKVYMLSSTVSSKILAAMAKSRGFNFIETLTGFKWMGNVSYNLIKAGNEVLFAFEEAIGFMCGSTVLDKDGISAALHAATLVSYAYHCLNKSLAEILEEIYDDFGHYVSCNSYFICHDLSNISNIFNRLRNFNSINNYPKDILNGKYRIKYVRDLTTGYDNQQPDNKAVLPISKSSQMITFTFENDLIMTLRTSGTEPKIKYYSEIFSSLENDKKIEDIMQILNEMLGGVISEFLQPTYNNLIAKS